MREPKQAQEFGSHSLCVRQRPDKPTNINEQANGLEYKFTLRVHVGEMPRTRSFPNQQAVRIQYEPSSKIVRWNAQLLPPTTQDPNKRDFRQDWPRSQLQQQPQVSHSLRGRIHCQQRVGGVRVLGPAGRPTTYTVTRSKRDRAEGLSSWPYTNRHHQKPELI